MPFFYRGLFPHKATQFALMSPIHSQNVAEFFVKALTQNNCIGKTIELGGTQILGWQEILKIICQVVGKKKLGIPAPFMVVHPLVKILEKLLPLPVSSEQLSMLAENNITDSKEHFQSFGIEPISFEAKNLSYLKKFT